MKIKFTDTPTPFISEFDPSEPLNTQELLANKEITIEVTHHTKTRLNVSMKHKLFQKSINQKLEGYKQHEESKYSYWDYKQHTSYRFVKSKKQNKEVLQEYLDKLIRQVFTGKLNITNEIDELNVNLIADKIKW